MATTRFLGPREHLPAHEQGSRTRFRGRIDREDAQAQPTRESARRSCRNRALTAASVVTGHGGSASRKARP